jgi:hypothetical protein
MELNYVTSEKGKPRLNHHRHLFFKEKQTNAKIIWRCTEHRKQACKARLHTTSTEIISEIGGHEPRC